MRPLDQLSNSRQQMGSISFFWGTVDEVFEVLLSLVFPAIVVDVVVVVVVVAVVEPCYTEE